MDEAREYEGTWYLPEQPDKTVSGRFSFSPEEGGTLALAGSFKDIRDLNTMQEPDIILGLSASGRPVTLYRCFESATQLGGSGMLRSSFSAEVAFEGVHFPTPDDVRFRAISVRYSHLEDWARVSGIEVQQPSEKELLVRYVTPEPILAANWEDWGIFIDVEAPVSTQYLGEREVSIKQETRVRIGASKEQPFFDCTDVMHTVRKFLALAMGRPTFVLAVRGTTEACKRTTSAGKEYSPPVHILLRSSSPPKATRALLPQDMLFSLADTHGELAAVLERWLERSELLGPVYNLYCATLYEPRMYAEHKFLSLAQAVESYHRRTRDGGELPPADHERRLTEILEAVPPEHREWLEGKLTYSNEVSLRKRLKELLAQLPEAVCDLLGLTDAFVHKVIATRNYLTHYDETVEGKAAGGEELYLLTEGLRVLVELCLLVDLGFTHERIGGLISRNRRYERLRAGE